LQDYRLVASADLLTDLVRANTALDQCFAQNLRLDAIPVGAGLARDGGMSANEWGDWCTAAIAGKLPHFDLRIYLRKKNAPNQSGRQIIRHCG
jgi:hypothetical protein